MSGQIHGQISRQEAWEMWEPYGQRGLDIPEVDPRTLSPEDTTLIALGSDDDTQSKLYGLFYDYDKPDEEQDFLTGFRDYVAENGVADELADILETSYRQQRAAADVRRVPALFASGEYASLIGGAVRELAKEGIFTDTEADVIVETRLFSPDGTPMMEYCPMTCLELSRLNESLSGFREEEGLIDCTIFNVGIIAQVIRLYGNSMLINDSNTPHEHVHGFIEGCEFFDITHDNGVRVPTASVSGSFAFEPSTGLVKANDYSGVENGELNEGWTEFMKEKLIEVEPRLAFTSQQLDGAYSQWRDVAGMLHNVYPKVFRAITQTALVEASPNHPTAKRDALQEMHEYADSALGEIDALSTLFATGGKLVDTHKY